MEHRREHERDAGLGEAALDAARVQVDPDAERLEQIGRAAIDDAARLPCLATGTPAPATTIAATVEMLNVPLRSPPVPHVSTTGAGVTGFANSSIVRASPSISSTVSPLVRSAIRNPPTWPGVASPP